MKILYLLQSNRFSGAENVVCQIIRMMKKDPSIEAIYASPDGQIREALAERNVTFVPLCSLSKKEVRRVIKEQKPDIIHAHDMRASFVAARACGKTPLISHIHNNSFDSRGLSVKSIAYLLAARKAKHIFWVSQSAFHGYAFHSLFKKKSSVLYNIIDINALYEKMKADDRKYSYDVVYLGRLSYPKNPQRLMRIFEKVKNLHPTVKIGVIGTGELEEETKALCHELNLDNTVDWLGFQSNPLKILYDAKVMIMASRWEGTPMCALEAMALGVPIVSTPTDGLCELISNGETGYLSDDDDTLAQKIAEILSNNEVYQTLHQNSLQAAIEYNDLNTYRTAITNAYVKK